MFSDLYVFMQIPVSGQSRSFCSGYIYSIQNVKTSFWYLSIIVYRYTDFYNRYVDFMLSQLNKAISYIFITFFKMNWIYKVII